MTHYKSVQTSLVLEAGTSYKGFDVLSVTSIAESNSKGIYLRHRKTGLEIFHLYNSDKENLFAYALRTVPEDSCGTPHILEHSVFCGSEKYPLKDPFVTLMNQSVNTFMNALTYSDRTVFPASSMVKSDYFNLLSVYSDAVFFPLLRKETFEQEGYHLEVTNKDNYSIQGVVYNEMKGSYSSFENIMFNACFKSLVHGSVFENDSGGDPLEIPHLTYDTYKSFYEKYYRPSNCLLFLYGNIPTIEQLDFLQKDVLDRVEQKYLYSKDFVTIDFRNTLIDTIKLNKILHVKAPVSNESDTGSVVNINWLIAVDSDCEQRLECEILSEILTGHDGALLTNALLSTDLGSDESLNTGLLTEINTVQFTAGIRNVKTADEQKACDYIFDSLQKLYKKGITASDIEAAIMSVGFDIQEITREGGPYSLTLMDRVLDSWIYGKSLSEFLNYQKKFSIVASRFRKDPLYAQKILKEYLIENKNFTVVITTPDKKYSRNRERDEKKLIALLRKNKTYDDICCEMQHRQFFQQQKDAITIPHVRISDLNVKADTVVLEKDVLPGTIGTVPLFVSREATNGIVYIDVAFPCDVIAPEDYLYIPFYAVTATNIGWKGADWAAAARKTALCCGDLGADIITSTIPDCYEQSIEKKADYVGRDWVIFHIKTFEDKTEQALIVLQNCLTKTDFSDFKRINSLLQEYKNEIDSAVVSSGQSFALKRAAYPLNRTQTVKEIWKGFTQLQHVHQMSKDTIKKVAEKLVLLDKKIKTSGGVIHVTADGSVVPSVKTLLKKFVYDTKLTAPIQKNCITQKMLLKFVFSKEQKLSSEIDEIFKIPAQVGFCATVMYSSPFTTKESAAEIVAAHWLSGSVVWENLRTIGGSYGSAALTDTVEKIFSFITYRDPSPEKSKKRFIECLESALLIKLSSLEVEKIIIGTFGSEIQPRSAAVKGYTGFLRELFGILDKDREKNLSYIAEIDANDIHEACLRLYKRIKNSKTVIFSKKN